MFAELVLATSLILQPISKTPSLTSAVVRVETPHQKIVAALRVLGYKTVTVNVTRGRLIIAVGSPLDAAKVKAIAAALPYVDYYVVDSNLDVWAITD